MIISFLGRRRVSWRSSRILLRRANGAQLNSSAELRELRAGNRLHLGVCLPPAPLVTGTIRV